MSYQKSWFVRFEQGPLPNSQPVDSPPLIPDKLITWQIFKVWHRLLLPLLG